MEDYTIANITVFGVISWTILFLITRKMFHKRSIKFCGHIVSTIHALQFIFLASYSVQDWTAPLSPLASSTSPMQMKILAADLSYFIYDLGLFQFNLKNVRTSDILHHIFALVAIIVGLSYKRYGSEGMAEIWTGELSAPLFFLRDILKELDYKDTNLYLVADILYVFIFTFSKVVCGTYLIYLAFTVNYPLICKVAALAIQLLNIFWFYKLVRYCMHEYVFKRRRDSSQKIHSS